MINYYQEFIKITSQIKESGEKKKLLLHACCAPCSIASLEAVVPYFDVTVFFYNPNITDKGEYDKRLSEEARFLKEAYGDKVGLICGDYRPEVFYELSAGLEAEPERGARCHKCYDNRLKETGITAKRGGFDYFASTLSVSPYKDAKVLNEFGLAIGESLGISYLPTDFKKNNGYKRSIELSKIYGLYRQNYCGCEFSAR